MNKAVVLLLGVAIGVAATYLYFKEAKKEDITFVKPKGIITPAQAKALDVNWTKERKRAVDSVAGRPDNRSSWWSLEDIQNYLAYTQNQADSLGYKMNGIRVYLGVYAANAPNRKANYTTMFIVPTGKKSISEANSVNINLQSPNGDIPGGDPLNDGSNGVPPGSGYQ
jgi:hypothetical protein